MADGPSPPGGIVSTLTSVKKRLPTVYPALFAAFRKDDDVHSSEDGGDDANELHIEP